MPKKTKVTKTLAEEVAEEQLKKFVTMLVQTFAKHVRPNDVANKIPPVEVLLRDPIEFIVKQLGDAATPELVANNLYELLHIGDNITYALSHRIITGHAAHKHDSQEKQ